MVCVLSVALEDLPLSRLMQNIREQSQSISRAVSELEKLLDGIKEE